MGYLSGMTTIPIDSNYLRSHYTSLDVGLTMMKESRLRFSHYKYLNDPTEGAIFLKLLERHRHDIFHHFSNTEFSTFFLPSLYAIIPDFIEGKLPFSRIDIKNQYTFSLTSKYDDLMFWNQNYSGKNGVSLVFNMHKLQRLSIPEGFHMALESVQYPKIDLSSTAADEEVLKTILPRFEQFQRYITPDLKEKTQEYLAMGLYIDAAIFLSGLMCLFKTFAWKHEDEFRLILTPDLTGDNDVYSKSVSISSHMGELRPYIFSPSEFRSDGDLNMSQCLHSIILGPGHPTEAVEYMEHFKSTLDGYSHVKILPSAHVMK